MKIGIWDTLLSTCRTEDTRKNALLIVNLTIKLSLEIRLLLCGFSIKKSITPWLAIHLQTLLLIEVLLSTR